MNSKLTWRESVAGLAFGCAVVALLAYFQHAPKSESKLVQAPAAAPPAYLVRQPLQEPLPPVDPSPEAVAEMQSRARQVSTELLEQTKRLSEKLREAERNLDFPYYESFKNEPGHLLTAWRRSEGVREVDLKPFQICAVATNTLGLVMYYTFEKPSEHFRSRYRKSFKEDLKACSDAIARKE